MSVESRLANLEATLVFQEDTISQLNDVVIRQQQELDVLRREIIALRDKLKELTPSLVVPQDQETPPPHY